MFKPYAETHVTGHIELNVTPEHMHGITGEVYAAHEGDLGISIAEDGRVWVCVNGIALIRFKPTIKGG